MSSCKKCGAPTDANWKTMCTPCFRASKEEEREALEEKVNFLETQNYQLGLEILSLHKQLESANGLPKLDIDFVRKLKHLCHPDRHGNSPLSNSVTAELNRMNF